MNPSFFLLVHFFAFLALLINVGIAQDGYDNQTRTFTFQGKIASFVILPISLAGLLVFWFTHQLEADLGSVYLGYLITIISFIMPFLTTCHNAESKRRIKINLVGWLTIGIGLSGLVSSVLWTTDQRGQTESVNNYMGLLGQFIASTSALIALSGATVYTDSNGKTRLSDLGNIAAIVILVGFGISAINSVIADRKQQDLANTAKDTKKTLLSADSVITKQLKPNLVVVNKQIADVLPTLQKIMDQLRDLQTINQKITTLQQEVAKNTEVEKLEQIVTNHQTAVNNLKTTVEQVSQETQKINQLQQTLNTYQTQLASLERNANRIEGLENKITDLGTKVEKLRTETEKIGDMQEKLNKVQETITTLQTNLNTIQTSVRDLQSLKGQGEKLEDLKNKMNLIEQQIRQLRETKRDSL